MRPPSHTAVRAPHAPAAAPLSEEQEGRWNRFLHCQKLSSRLAAVRDALTACAPARIGSPCRTPSAQRRRDKFHLRTRADQLPGLKMSRNPHSSSSRSSTSSSDVSAVSLRKRDGACVCPHAVNPSRRAALPSGLSSHVCA